MEEEREFASVHLVLPVLQLKRECETWLFFAWDLSHDGYPHIGIWELWSRSASERMHAPQKLKKKKTEIKKKKNMHIKNVDFSIQSTELTEHS